MKGLSGYVRQIYREMAFDYTYGVRRKSNEEHPFAGVLKQPTEPYYTTTPTQEVFKLFCYYQIGKYYQGSFSDFLLLPYPVAVEVMDECKHIHNERAKHSKNSKDRDIDEDEFFT